MIRNLARLFQRRAVSFPDARQGATAVEFALIAPMFLGLLIALFETTSFLYAQASLQAAAVQAGRLFMTGQAQNGSMTQSQLQSAICPMIQTLFNCSKLVINVQTYSSFSSANTSMPQIYDAQGNLSTGSYNPGTPGSVMVVQLAYPWSVVSGPLGFTLANLPNGSSAMMGVTAFRVEPYSS